MALPKRFQGAREYEDESFEIAEVLHKKFGRQIKITIGISEMKVFKADKLVGTIEPLKQQFGRFLKAQYEFTSKGIRIYELKKYLKIYDLRKQGMKWKDIIREFNTKGDCETIRLEFQRFHRKAKKIISNAEQGNFPGKY